MTSRSIASKLYGRLGSRVVYVCIAGGCVLGIIAGVVSTAVLARYLKLSIGQAVSLFAVAMPTGIGFALVGLLASADQLRTARAWSRDSASAESAAAGWYAVVGLDRAVTRCAAPAAIALPIGISYAIIEFHKPWYTAIALLIGGLVAVGGTWVIVVSGSELVLRPMVEDIAAHLPADFEPEIHGTTLRTKAFAPLPVVTMMAAIIVGAYANLSSNLGLRLVFAAGVALAVTAVATAIFVLLNRSVLSPIDDLTAATRRVREGDITTPVPLVTADELGLLAYSFNQMLAELRRHTEELQASRERIVTAATEERRRVERDIHDGAQQQLVVLGLKLGMAKRLIEADPRAAVKLHEELGADLERALAELRDLAHGLYPPLLESDGLLEAIREAASRAALPTAVDCDGIGRYRPELEAAVYFCCLEALQNAAKHAGEGAHARIRLGQRDGMLHFEVTDDGHGRAGALIGTGIQNMTDRTGALGGELHVRSAPGKGTTVAGAIPL